MNDLELAADPHKYDAWNNLALNLSFVFWAAGLLVVLGYIIKLSTVSGSKDKYDFIKHPKNTGYRGIHDVYEYDVKSDHGKPYKGLLIELQYRTTYQHAWPLVLRSSDLSPKVSPSFSRATRDTKRRWQWQAKFLLVPTNGKRVHYRTCQTERSLQSSS